MKQQNIVNGSAPLWIKKWVKVKYVPNEEDILASVQTEQMEKDKGALEMAQAIILEQMNNHD